ncbi:MAG: hypothetical protein H7Z72_17590 [Bacteroidetes bacterium]|nr:hypothetical protein [Fibrella sp.]
MENARMDDYEKRVVRLLERIESKRQLLKMYRGALEPSSLMIEETTESLQRYVNELDALMQEHGLSIQLIHEQAA